MKKLKPIVSKIFDKSGKILLKYFRSDFDTKQKDPKTDDIVTTADLESEKVILNILKKNFPKYSILSEENGLIDKNSDYKWIVDPLDGTHNFAHGIPFFATALALKYKEKIIFSAINAPILKERVFSKENKGTYMNDKKLNVSNSNIEYIKNSMFQMLGVWNWNNLEFRKIFQNIINKFYSHFRIFGSMAVASLNIATKRTNCGLAYNLSPWDIAPAYLTMKEAGTLVTNLKGKKPVFNKKESIVFSTSKDIHKILMECVET